MGFCSPLRPGMLLEEGSIRQLHQGNSSLDTMSTHRVSQRARLGEGCGGCPSLRFSRRRCTMQPGAAPACRLQSRRQGLLVRAHSTQTWTETLPAPTTAVSLAAPAAAAGPSPVMQLSPEAHQELIRSGGLVLVDYYTDWCGPCQLMHKELDKLTQAFPRGVAFAKFNCGHYEEFSTQQRIRSLPTFRLFKGGRCLEQVTGAKPIQLRQLLAHYCRP